MKSAKTGQKVTKSGQMSDNVGQKVPKMAKNSRKVTIPDIPEAGNVSGFDEK